MFMNQWNDDSMIGNFFSGYYYDEAYGVFKTDYLPGEELRISHQNGTCSDGKQKYALAWYAYNENFWLINFENASWKSDIYVCIESDPLASDYASAYFQWYAYGEYVWIQNFENIAFEGYSNIEETDTDEDGILWRYTKIDGVTSSDSILWSEFDDEIRIIWDINKSSLRWDISQNVYTVIRNFTPNNGSLNITNLSQNTWSSASNGIKLLEDSVLYMWDLNWSNVRIAWTQEWTKTLVVEGGNVYITGNITWWGMLWIIALSKDDIGWNIYIDPSVTDIHAILFADKSLISYKSGELWGTTSDSELANQLYIKWSVFIENTLWGGDTPFDCPFYIDVSDCDMDEAKKYDFNYLRRYRLVSDVSNQTGIDGAWNPVYATIPDYSGAESMMGDGNSSNTEVQKPWYRRFPFIIEYNPMIQQITPPFFD